MPEKTDVILWLLDHVGIWGTFVFIPIVIAISIYFVGRLTLKVLGLYSSSPQSVKIELLMLRVFGWLVLYLVIRFLFAELVLHRH